MHTYFEGICHNDRILKGGAGYLITGCARKKETALLQFYISVKWAILGSNFDKKMVWFCRPISQTLLHLVYSSGEA